MPTTKTRDDTENYYEDWGTRNPSFSVTDGR
jgi:hypothetical protein